MKSLVQRVSRIIEILHQIFVLTQLWFVKGFRFIHKVSLLICFVKIALNHDSRFAETSSVYEEKGQNFDKLNFKNLSSLQSLHGWAVNFFPLPNKNESLILINSNSAKNFTKICQSRNVSAKDFFETQCIL